MIGQRQLEVELSGSFGYQSSVLSLSPAFVEFETPDARSLLDRARAGETEAYGEICRFHETRLLRQALALCGNQALAEDLAQDTLVEGWRCLRRYNGRCRFFTWLCAILVNRYRNAIRGQRDASYPAPASGEGDLSEGAIDKLVDPASLPDESAQAREHAAIVWRCIRSLPLRHQQVVILRFYVDDSLEGIAAALDCSVGTVKSRLFHALDKLRSMRSIKCQFAISERKLGCS